MKELQDDFTTPEKSKMLLELGVPAESSNLYYFDVGSGFVNAPDLREYKENWSDCRYLPCWSVGRLMEIYCICTKQSVISLPYKFITEYIMDLITIRAYGNCMNFSRLEE